MQSKIFGAIETGGYDPRTRPWYKDAMAAGTTTLTGDSSTFTGGTTVHSGSLQLGDGGSTNTGAQQVLASILPADFNSTGDQALLLAASMNYFQLTGILVAGASLSLTTAARRWSSTWAT